MADTVLILPEDDNGSSGAAGTWKEPVANFASLPGTGNTLNDRRYVQALNQDYTWNGSAWIATPTSSGGGGGSANQYFPAGW